MGAAYFEDHGQETYDGDVVVIAPTLVSPKSRGRVWLRSTEPTDAPHILTNTLAEPDDVASLVAGVQMARDIAGQEPAQRDHARRDQARRRGVQGREEIEADLRRRLMLIYHPAGTCRMSDNAEGAVVDSSLRVHGTEALRVVDASIMPTITGGNTHAPTVMIAEKAADLIRHSA